MKTNLQTTSRNCCLTEDKKIIFKLTNVIKKNVLINYAQNISQLTQHFGIPAEFFKNIFFQLSKILLKSDNSSQGDKVIIIELIKLRTE